MGNAASCIQVQKHNLDEKRFVCISPSWLKCVSMPWGPGTEQTSLALMKVLHLLTSTLWPPTSFWQKRQDTQSIKHSCILISKFLQFNCFGSVLEQTGFGLKHWGYGSFKGVRSGWNSMGLVALFLTLYPNFRTMQQDNELKLKDKAIKEFLEATVCHMSSIQVIM